MRLPGSRYQEHGWERVRKLLANCSVPILTSADWDMLLAPEFAETQCQWYTEALAMALHFLRDSQRCQQAGNSYGESAHELAQSLLCELHALPSFWQAFLQALRQDASARHNEGALRKKINDMYSALRDKVDADNYQVATGLPCSPNKIYTWRMLDTSAHEVARIFGNWPHSRAQVEAILQRDCPAQPIEVARLKAGGQCRPEWIINWSATLAQFSSGPGPGPLHTKSKRFASLKNQPDKIAAMLEELNEYAALSATNFQEQFELEADEGQAWLEDYWRVMQQAGAHASNVPLPSQWQNSANADEFDLALDADALAELPAEERAFMAQDEEAAWLELTSDIEDADDDPALDSEDSNLLAKCARLTMPGILHSETPIPRLTEHSSRALCQAISLPPDYLQAASEAEDQTSLCYRFLAHESLGVRLAVYLQQLGPDDLSYPAAWLDPRSGQLPTCKQLAALAQISLPTLRKRRAQAIQTLLAGLGKVNPSSQLATS